MTVGKASALAAGFVGAFALGVAIGPTVHDRFGEDVSAGNGRDRKHPSADDTSTDGTRQQARRRDRPSTSHGTTREHV